ncbi:hypothetical protein PoB_004734500 [Plakobranchus ocellatus]|uniref:Uncharacterized protein n=1 Tax=Plakobranchus ocellatus TaxID=259542 RepID=A0AAV4BN28_9GAST|nr:hypothetical protein PoB_004734500 [Plakobranchus ocellatus]
MHIDFEKIGAATPVLEVEQGGGSPGVGETFCIIIVFNTQQEKVPKGESTNSDSLRLHNTSETQRRGQRSAEDRRGDMKMRKLSAEDKRGDVKVKKLSAEDRRGGVKVRKLSAEDRRVDVKARKLSA